MPKDTQTQQDTEFSLDLQKLRASLDRIHGKATSSSESSSSLGQQRKQEVEALGCHKDALSIIERIDKMSNEKLGDFLRTFEPMIEGMLPQWRERFQDMLDKANDQADDMAGAMN